MGLRPTGPGGIHLLPETTPAAPASGTLLYTKIGGGVYYRDVSGSEVGPLATSTGVAPANMVTTDTAQDITAVKTFTVPVKANVAATNLNDGRWVGFTTGSGPTDGTWALRDWAIHSTTGRIWRCSVAGTPGTWTEQALPSNVVYNNIQPSFSVGVSMASPTATSGSTMPDSNVLIFISNYWNSGEFTEQVQVKARRTAAAANSIYLDCNKLFKAVGFSNQGTTGATTASRWMGGTATAAPTTGTFAVGDFVTTSDGKIFICTTAGTPGTWTQVGGGVSSVNTRTGAVTGLAEDNTVVHLSGDETVAGVKTFSSIPIVPDSSFVATTKLTATGTKDATTFLRGDNTWAAPAAGGGTSGVEFDLTQDWTTTTPTTPATGSTIFTRHRARRTLAVVGPTGQDTALQPAMFSNRIARYTVTNAVAAAQVEGMATTVVGTAAAAVTLTATTFFTSMVRHLFTSAATVNAMTGVRATTAQWHMSTTANKGGFFYVARFGIDQFQAGGRGFIGFTTATTTTLATNPSLGLNMFGIGWDAVQTTMRFLSNGAAPQTATHVDLGANFPVNNSATNFYEVRLFAASGGGQNVGWSVTRLNDGQFTQGTVATALPANDTLLVPYCMIGNGTTAAAVRLAVQSLYLETDN